MTDDKVAVDSNESHEQFIKRASEVFPVNRASAWSRVERAVFNHLMAQLVITHHYSSISTEMLRRCKDDMEEIVWRIQGG
jgi:hypothetical protein